MNVKSVVFLFLIFSSLCFSCKKGNTPNEKKPIDEAGNGNITVAKAEMVRINPGRNRAELSVLLNADVDIAKIAVFWNDSDSVVIPIDKVNKLDTINKLINGLEERNYDFSFYTYNSKGNRSGKTLIRERIYGEMYENTLVNRRVDNAVLEPDGNVIIDWDFISEAIGVEISYVDENNISHTITAPRSELQTILRRYKRNSKFEYRTLFKPKTNALDVFYAVAEKDNVVKHEPALVGSISDRIIANSNLVKTLISNVTKNTYPGLEESYIQFIDVNNNPQSLFILQVDLNNEMVSLEAGTPSDGTVYGSSQTVSDMIKAKNVNSKDKKVIAAVNADFFTLATGIPLGPTVKNGVEIKPLNNTYYCFVGILDNGVCLIGKPNIYQDNLSKMKEALGGTAHALLVSGGVVQTQTDISRAPRTTAGVIGTSKVIFVVVDGRQAGYSVGLNLREMAMIHKAIGVKNATNLDGGGSTTFIVKDDQNQYIVKNKLSDGSQRRIANSWLVMGE